MKENNTKWDVIGLGEVRGKVESFTTVQSGHLLYHSEANNGPAGVGFLEQEIVRHHNKSILWEFQSNRNIPTHNRQIPTEDRSIICANDFYNTNDKILEKQTHYTIVMGSLMRKLEDKQMHQKGRQYASAWASKMREEALL